MWLFKRLLFNLCMGWVLALGSASAEPDRRVALVIGNGAYKVAPALPNPTIDAKAVAASFRRIGFEVIDGYDLTIGQMRAKLAEFAAAIPDSKAAVVYYAGHGVSVDEENYLLPTDIALKNPSDLDLGAISLTLVLKQMKREERVNVVILDACRDNPFAKELARTFTRSAIADRGLSRVESDLAKGTLLAFASDPKSTALDGKPGENSPFSKALLNHLEDIAVSIDTIMSRVRAEVWTDTKSKQLPWVNTSIIGEFILNPQVAPLDPGQLPYRPMGADPATDAPVNLLPHRINPQQERIAQETRLWDSAEKSNLAEDYRAYLDAYPNGVFAAMAKNRIAKLGPPTDAVPGQSGSTTPAVPVTASPTPNPVDFSSAGLKAEVGTQQTEKVLGLTKAQRKEVQQRLLALEYEPGKASGTFSPTTRSAIIAWQNGHSLHPTGWLGPLQYAALLAESDAPLGRYLSGKYSEPQTDEGARSRKVNAGPVRVVTRRPVVTRRFVGSHGGGNVGGGGDPAAAIGRLLGGAARGFVGF
jgi:uncharacterized caspase-like protein